MKLLYIEDMPIHVHVMQRITDHLGFELVLASNASDGLLLLATHPNVILVDISLPDLDGLMLVRSIRNEMPNVPIVAVTAHAMPDDRERCLSAGCNEYVTKPFGWELMLNLLREIQALLDMDA